MKKMQFGKIFWRAINFAVWGATAMAGIFLILSLVAMGENLSVSGTPLAVCIACLSWFALLGLLAWLEKKFGI